MMLEFIHYDICARLFKPTNLIHVPHPNILFFLTKLSFLSPNKVRFSQRISIFISSSNLWSKAPHGRQ